MRGSTTEIFVSEVRQQTVDRGGEEWSLKVKMRDEVMLGSAFV